jgi:hypothetical protein
MLYREIIAVCSEIHTKHINTLCGQNVEFGNFKYWLYMKRPLGFRGLRRFIGVSIGAPTVLCGYCE